MIVCVLSDGTRRALNAAEVTLAWEQPKPPMNGEEGGTERVEFALADVKALILMEPEVGWMPGDFAGMPVLGVRYKNPGEPSIEVPMPLEYAAELGASLIEAAAKQGVHPSDIVIVRTMPDDPMM